MSAPTPAPIDPRSPRNERSGCVVALYALFAIGLVAVLGGAAAVYLFLQSEEGQKLTEVARGGMEWLAVATDAPGAEELRGAGCEVAMVNSAGSAIQVIQPLLQGDAEAADALGELENLGTDLEELTLVVCVLPRLSIGSRECGEFARTYAGAVEFPPDEFALFVMRQGQDQPTCSGLYAPDGELRRSFPE